jgi:hypothetical protein
MLTTGDAVCSDVGDRRHQLRRRRPTTRTVTPTTDDVDCEDDAD